MDAEQIRQQLAEEHERVLAEEKSRLQALFVRELAEHKQTLEAEKERELAAFRASVSVEAPGVFPPPPPPPEISLVLSDNLGNLPTRRAPLPTVVTFRGQTSRDRERIRLLFGYARLLGRVPGAIFTDPLADLQEVLARLRGESRPCSPAPRTSRSRSGARRSLRSTSRSSTTRGRSRSPLGRSSRGSSSSQNGPTREEFMRQEQRIDQLSADLRRLENLIRRRTIRRSALLGRSASPVNSGGSTPGAAAVPGKPHRLGQGECLPEGKMLWPGMAKLPI